MIVFTASGFWRTLCVTAPSHADAYLQRCRSMSQTPVTKAFVRRVEYLRVVRKKLDRKAEWIEGPAKGQIHAGEEFILRSYHCVLKSALVNCLPVKIATHNIVSAFLVE